MHTSPRRRAAREAPPATAAPGSKPHHAAPARVARQRGARQRPRTPRRGGLQGASTHASSSSCALGAEHRCLRANSRLLVLRGGGRARCLPSEAAAAHAESRDRGRAPFRSARDTPDTASLKTGFQCNRSSSSKKENICRLTMPTVEQNGDNEITPCSACRSEALLRRRAAQAHCASRW